jgi:hypothetical protein
MQISQVVIYDNFGNKRESPIFMAVFFRKFYLISYILVIYLKVDQLSTIILKKYFSIWQ